MRDFKWRRIGFLNEFTDFEYVSIYRRLSQQESPAYMIRIWDMDTFITSIAAFLKFLVHYYDPLVQPQRRVVNYRNFDWSKELRRLMMTPPSEPDITIEDRNRDDDRNHRALSFVRFLEAAITVLVHMSDDEKKELDKVSQTTSHRIAALI